MRRFIISVTLLSALSCFAQAADSDKPIKLTKPIALPHAGLKIAMPADQTFRPVDAKNMLLLSLTGRKGNFTKWKDLSAVQVFPTVISAKTPSLETFTQRVANDHVKSGGFTKSKPGPSGPTRVAGKPAWRIAQFVSKPGSKQTVVQTVWLRPLRKNNRALYYIVTIIVKGRNLPLATARADAICKSARQTSFALPKTVTISESQLPLSSAEDMVSIGVPQGWFRRPVPTKGKTKVLLRAACLDVLNNRAIPNMKVTVVHSPKVGTGKLDWSNDEFLAASLPELKKAEMINAKSAHHSHRRVQIAGKTGIEIITNQQAGNIKFCQIRRQVLNDGRAYTITLTWMNRNYKQATAAMDVIAATFKLLDPNMAPGFKSATARLTDDEPLNILFIGNSFTYGGDLPKVVASMASAAGWARPSITMVAPGGKTLRFHRKSPDTLKQIDAGNWDFVVMQDQSARPTRVGDPKGFKADATWLYDRVKKSSPTAKIVLYQTWARHEKHKVYPSTFSSRDLMQRQVNVNYRDAVEKYIPKNASHRVKKDVRLAPCGEAWQANHRDKNLMLHSGDFHHANKLGSYLNGLVLYSTIYDRKVTGMTAGPIDPADAAYLQKISDKITGAS